MYTVCMTEPKITQNITPYIYQQHSNKRGQIKAYGYKSTKEIHTVKAFLTFNAFS